MGCAECNRKPLEVKSNKIELNKLSENKIVKENSNDYRNMINNGSNSNNQKKNSLDPQKVQSIKKIKSLGDDIKISVNISQNNNSVKEEYEIYNDLGKGSFGTVYKVYHKITKQIRAMKVIKKDTVLLQDDDRKFLKEIEILISLDHPNIIKIFDYYVDETNYYLIMEYVSGGELYDTISKWDYYDEHKAGYILKQILSAVAYMHDKNIVHRDLKPENMLVENKSKTKDGVEEINIKIIDFGTCNFYKKNENLSLKVGSPYYIAPEVLKKKYNEKSDIWSCGVILYVLLVGYPPFISNSTPELLKKVEQGIYSLDGPLWSKISKNAKDLVKNMMNVNMNDRYSADKCLHHPFITENCTNILVKEDFNACKNFLNNLKNWNNTEKFQQATVAYIIHHLQPSKDLEAIKKIFKHFDQDGNGRLSYEELKIGIIKYFGKEISDLKMNEIISEIDGDADGYIGYEEFLRVFADRDNILSEKNLLLAFKKFDTNGDGKLSIEEIRSVLGNSNLGYVENLMKFIDDDKNNNIDFDEFKNLMICMTKNNNGTIISLNELDPKLEIKEKSKLKESSISDTPIVKPVKKISELKVSNKNLKEKTKSNKNLEPYEDNQIDFNKELQYSSADSD